MHTSPRPQVTPSTPAPSPGVAFVPSERYPDPRIEVLHESFLGLRLFSAGVEQLATGCRWSEGPVWFGDGRFLLWSDIPNNRILRWDDASGEVSVFRSPSNHANGLARDRQGRLLACEHLTRRVTRTEYDGSVTVLAERWQGKRLNSPNDIVCSRDGAVWFTDPLFGIGGHWEGEPAASETPWAVYRIDPAGGEPQRVVDDIAAPNGLAFSPDEKTFYLVESRAVPHRRIWQYDVGASGALSNQRLFVDAQGPGAYDGIAVDAQGNVWCGFGSNGAPGVDPVGLDGVRVYNPAGQAIGHIHLPERCANLCFGGARRNRLFMAASHSLYALYVNVQGAT
jgi:gluconolactonase